MYCFLLNVNPGIKNHYKEAFLSLNEADSETTDIIDKDIRRSLFDVYPDQEVREKKQQTLKKL